jgi:hypothetical protein
MLLWLLWRAVAFHRTNRFLVNVNSSFRLRKALYACQTVVLARSPSVFRRVRKSRKATIKVFMPTNQSVRPYACPFACNSGPTKRILVKLRILSFFRKYVEEIQVSWKSDKITGTLHENVFPKYVEKIQVSWKSDKIRVLYMKMFFSKTCWKNSSFVKIRQNNVYFTWKCFFENVLRKFKFH